MTRKTKKKPPDLTIVLDFGGSATKCIYADINLNGYSILLVAKTIKNSNAKSSNWFHRQATAKATPLFVILLATGTLQTLLNEKPVEIDEMFNRWTKTVTKSMDSVEQEIIERQKLAITQAAGDLIRKAERQEASRFFKSILPGAIAASFVLVVGFVAGSTIPPALKGGYVAGQNLTANDIEALRWANSKEGQYARQLISWNADYLEVCDQNAAKMPIKLQMGQREAKGGFCANWQVI